MSASSQFTIAPYDINAIGANGGGAVKLRVLGFWSDEVATLYVSRKSMWLPTPGERAHEWKFEMSHSSGGRDPNVIQDDLEAEVNLAQGLIALASLGVLLRSKVEELEALYQRECEQEKIRAAAAEVEKAARIAADEPLYMAGATALINTARSMAMASGREVEITAFERGSDRPRKVRFIPKRSGRVTMRDWFGYAINLTALTETLATCSRRSHGQGA